MADNDVQVQLEHLQQEEALIMRELQELEEKSRTGDSGNVGSATAPAASHIDDPDEALAELLADCEKEVRDAKGYIADEGPPLHIVRLRPGETGPKSATFLSRPRHTGVDFTVPVTLKAYTDVVRNPIFLNDIRDKIRARAYASSSEYIADMRLLYRNTVQFNKGPDDAWVVQHSKLLLDAAEDAVESRIAQFKRIETSLRQSSASARRQNAQQASTKRKRPTSAEATGSEARSSPPVGTPLEVWWGNPFRRWYIATIVDRAGNDEVLLRYSIDDSTQWVALNTIRWRTPNARQPSSARPKRPEPPPSKKRKGPPVPSSPRSSGGAPINVDALPTPSNTDVDGFKRIISTHMNDLTESIKEQLQEHASRAQAEMHRSDHLQRILFAVQDAQNVIVASVDKLTSAMYQLRKDVSALKRSGFASAANTDRRTGAKDESSALASSHLGDMGAQNKGRGESRLADDDDVGHTKSEAQKKGEDKYVSVSKSQKGGTDTKKMDRHSSRDGQGDRKSSGRGLEAEKDDQNGTRENARNVKERGEREERDSKTDNHPHVNTSDKNKVEKDQKESEQRKDISNSDDMEISPVKSSITSSEGGNKEEWTRRGDIHKTKDDTSDSDVKSGVREKRKERVMKISENPERLKGGREQQENRLEEDILKDKGSDKRRNLNDSNDKDSERSGSLVIVGKGQSGELTKSGKRHEVEQSVPKHESDSSESSEDSSDSSSDSDGDDSRTEAAKTQNLRMNKCVKRSSAGPRPKVSRFAQAPEESANKGASKENGKSGSNVIRNGSKKDLTDQNKEKVSVFKSVGRNDGT